MPELVDELAESLRAKLKASQGNPVDLLALRTALQVVRPDVDQLTRAALPILKKYLPEMSGTFLDVGCYGGWAYPYVRDRVDYHGIDTWGTGVECASQLFGSRFEKADLFEYTKKHDVVWCSQLLFTGIYDAAWHTCKGLANKLCIFLTPDGTPDYAGSTERYGHEGRFTVVVWRG